MRKTTKQQFKKEYAELQDKLGGVKEKLTQIKKELISLRRKANQLFKKGGRDLYEATNRGCRPAFAELPDCMDNLVEWAEIWDIVAVAVNALPCRKAAK